MKHDLKSKAHGLPPAPRFNTSAAHRNELIEQAQHAKRQASIRTKLGLGGLALAAAFIYLATLTPTPPSLKTAAVATKKAPVTTKPAPAVAVKAATPATPAAKEKPAPAPLNVATPPPATPDASTSAATEPTAAERLATEPLMLLVGPDSQRETATRRDTDLLQRAINGKAWDAYRGLLGQSIKAALPKLEAGRGLNKFDPLWNEPVLYQVLLRWKTLGCFSEAAITSVVTDSYTGGMLTWLLHNNQAMEELLLTIQPADDPAKVLKFLTDAWSVNEDKYLKYFPLTLACAVVFDHPMTIPNPVGKTEYGVEQSVVPMLRFLWYVKKNEQGKLAAPVHHASARDLIWVVCAPVTTSELEWSLDKMQLRRKNWGQAYGMVKYLMERAVNGLDPYKEYSFAEILKEGGICSDQSYFCVNTARAQGIPAMTIGGETNMGGHAWAGVKIDANEWLTTVGRIAGASKGEAYNPQTGTSISEQEIQLWNDRSHQSPVVTLSVARHLWLADFFAVTNNTVDNAAAIRLANSLGHSFVETWQALYALLVKQTHLTGTPATPDNLEEWKKFAADMRREYKDNPRMASLAATAEVEQIFPFVTEGDAKRTLLRERRRVERDSGEQKDLLASSLKREAEVIIKTGGPDAKRDVSRLYDRALRDYGGSITGFKTMADDYFNYAKDDKELARKAARDIELAFKRVVETGTTNWFRATTEAEICKMICGYYRAADEPERATMLEKRYEIQLRRAKRGAL